MPPTDYDAEVVAVSRSDRFDRWLRALPDPQARARIKVRIRRLSLGNPRDVRPISAGINEMRIHYGPGYRVYFLAPGPALAVLLCGGDKRSQHQDIARARRLAAEWRG